MTEIEIPLTTYLVKSSKPKKRFGSPGSMPVNLNHRIYARVPLDKIPLDGTISSAVLRFYEHKPNGTGSRNLRVYNLTSNWNSSITWDKVPTTGTLQGTQSRMDPANMTPWDIDLTAWAVTRSRLGLRIDSSSDAHFVRGSAAAVGKPVLIVNYVTLPEQPGNLNPDGGAVSVDRPILTYAGDEEMVEQLIDFSIDEGDTTSYTTSWLPATEGRFDPATDPATPTATVGGPEIFWRARTNGPKGISEVSEWASYTYAPLPVVTVLSPGPTTADGSPPLQWTTADQTSWRASLSTGSKTLDDEKWANDPLQRDWTPENGVAVPTGTGRFTLEVMDDVSPRAVAEGAPTWQTVLVDFTTTDEGTGTPVATSTLTFEDPIPAISGTRAGGVPDFVALYRDGVQVPIWSEADEMFYKGWAPGVKFFTGGAFTIRDYTADLRHEHTWTVRTKTGTVASLAGPAMTAKFTTPSVWLVDPRTGDQVEIEGNGEVPSVTQTTEEASILHTPLNDGLIVEPIRRRIIRTTRSGTITGMVINEDEATMDRWVEDDSALRYRLIFGKVNWSVIIGDYSPADVFYPESCGPDRLMVSLNWWQRLEND